MTSEPCGTKGWPWLSRGLRRVWNFKPTDRQAHIAAIIFVVVLGVWILIDPSILSLPGNDHGSSPNLLKDMWLWVVSLPKGKAAIHFVISAVVAFVLVLTVFDKEPTVSTPTGGYLLPFVTVAVVAYAAICLVRLVVIWP